MYKQAAGRVNLLLRVCANMDIFSAEEKNAWWSEIRRLQIRNKKRKDYSAKLQMSKLWTLHTYSWKRLV